MNNYSIIEENLKEIENSLVKNLQEYIQQVEPYKFEELALKVLLAMGYGGKENNGITTQKSRDGGIDGIINEDPLGLKKIYLQVKRYKDSVKLPDVRNFVGAMSTEKGDQGVFITSGSFTKDAISFAEKSEKRIALIDGEYLARLMIAYRVGVQEDQVYTTYKIDKDFFDEYLQVSEEYKNKSSEVESSPTDIVDISIQKSPSKTTRYTGSLPDLEVGQKYRMYDQKEGKYDAYAHYERKGRFIILAGSKIQGYHEQPIDPGAEATRQSAVFSQGNSYTGGVLGEDLLCKSPNVAATIVRYGAANAKAKWKPIQ